MLKATMTAAVAALLMAASPLALAQGNSSSAVSNTGAIHTSVTQTRIQPGQFLATDLKGADVYDAQNKKVASVKDMILDRDGRVANVVLDVDGKYVGVPMSDLKVATDDSGKPRVTTTKNENELKSAQAFDLDNKGATTGSSTRPVSTTTTTTTTRPADTTK